ncbi:MAG: 3-deoxy-D-manno-octulosonic acid transferase [Sedimentisphaerales bacterium]|nr:3-deoxy-D-manno-octulosonic acid transferase [Sedimentisphaerales bacterium]
MRIILDLMYLLVAIAYSPVIIYRAVRYKRYRTGWGQRFGKISRRSPHKKCIWLHAVSVGEVNAAKTILKQLENKFSDFEIVISTTTDTGFARATTLFSKNHQVIYFPFDFYLIIKRTFRNIQPDICLLMELEIWPNFVQIAKQSNIPVIVVNGRMSDKSFPRYQKIKPLVKKMFGKISLTLAQTEQYAQRFKELGCPDEKVIVTNSLKYDTAQITDKVEGADIIAAQLNIGSEKLWVTGATGNDEEKILLDVYRKLKEDARFADLRLVIVPRKPERFDEVAQLIERRGLPLIRYSQVKNNTAPPPTDSHAVILGDTMGDLRKFYSLATIIFVGRSLVPMGGSDMVEAAALGKCTVFGPYAFNFKQTVDALLADSGAIMVKDQKELLQTMQKCLTDSDFAQTVANNGREVIRKNQGATKNTIDQIARFLTTA